MINSIKPFNLLNMFNLFNLLNRFKQLKPLKLVNLLKLFKPVEQDAHLSHAFTVKKKVLSPYNTIHRKTVCIC